MATLTERIEAEKQGIAAAKDAQIRDQADREANAVQALSILQEELTKLLEPISPSTARIVRESGLDGGWVKIEVGDFRREASAAWLNFASLEAVWVHLHQKWFLTAKTWDRFSEVSNKATDNFTKGALTAEIGEARQWFEDRVAEAVAAVQVYQSENPADIFGPEAIVPTATQEQEPSGFGRAIGILISLVLMISVAALLLRSAAKFFKWMLF